MWFLPSCVPRCPFWELGRRGASEAENEVPCSKALVPLPSQSPALRLPKDRDAGQHVAQRACLTLSAWLRPGSPGALLSTLEAIGSRKTERRGVTLYQSWRGPLPPAALGESECARGVLLPRKEIGGNRLHTEHSPRPQSLACHVQYFTGASFLPKVTPSQWQGRAQNPRSSILAEQLRRNTRGS